MVTLNIIANINNTGEVMDIVDSELDRNDFPVDLRPEILIAVEEAFVNIASYAYKPEEDGYVELSVDVDEKAVIRFTDWGEPFNPLEGNAPDLNVPIMEREIGGLGIHFIKNLMDEANYEYSGGNNILTITKNMTKKDREI
ncbi:MAG: ATP-binding protein [Oscillospiraceae bacterium]|nr:ATP-binding protein [Oscillospiraceae bacterium]